MIMLEKEIYKYCKDNNLDFDIVYSDSNRTYNYGYNKLDKKNVIRPILKQVDGKIGGHCIVSNAKILSEKSWMAKLLVNQNNKYV